MTHKIEVIPLLNVEDVERAARFYAEVFGFEAVNVASPNRRRQRIWLA